MSTLNNVQPIGLRARLRSWFLAGKWKKTKETSEAHADTYVPICRVLHVINGEYYSGAERVQDLLAKNLPTLGVDVGFACVKSGLFAERRSSQDTPLYDITMRSRFDLRAAFKLARIVRQEGYDMIHAHTPRTLLIAVIAGMLTRLPVVYHVHSPASADSTRWLNNRINALVEWFCMGWVAATIPVSESLGRRTVASGFSPDMVHVVKNGVPSRQTRPTRSEEEREWTVGTIALFRPRKGTEVLLDAIGELRKQWFPVRLRAVGPFETDEYEQKLKERADQLGIGDAIDWTGFTSNVDAEFAKMDLFVLPSLFGEGLPMVVIEAMSAGVPVIAAQVEGIPEAIRDGKDGLLFEPGDVEGLVEAIRKFVDGKVDWDTIHTQEVVRHAEAFSDKTMASGVAEVYEQVIMRTY